MSSVREFGVLMHPSSLPSEHGIGDLGKRAYAFADWLHAVGASVWQILPLVPAGAGNSPYSTWSALSGNPLLIDLEHLVAEGLLPPVEVPQGLDSQRVDFERVSAFKYERLELAAGVLLDSPTHRLYDGFQRFLSEQSWLQDAALFAAIKKSQAQQPWWAWPAALKNRESETIERARLTLSRSVDKFCVLQYLFDVQWHMLRTHCAEHGIDILGDMPIYVDADSVDVWCNRQQFQLDDEGRALRVAGVPPDAFSDSGQLWGNPLYDWDAMSADGYAWWVQRLKRGFDLTQRVRIDHFRGLSAYWSVPADAPDARSGCWVPGPGMDFFKQITAQMGPDLAIVAEDLGTIDEDVVELVSQAAVPNMLVLQFAFGGDADNWYLPHQHGEKSVVYTGTHDNDTTVGWWHSASEKAQHHVRTYFGADGHDIAWTLIRACLSSVAQTAMIPVQDILALGSEGRMNTPSVGLGNWGWRLSDLEHLRTQQGRLRALADLYSRTQ